MLLKDIIAQLDKSPANEDWVSVSDLAEQFSIFHYGLEDEHERFKCYWIGNHLCADTWVGFRAYFFDGELMAVSYQPARKSDEKFYFVLAVAAKAKQYIVSLMIDEDEPLDELDLNEDIDEGYYVEYTAQLLTDKIMIQAESGYETVDVDRKWKDPNDHHVLTHKVRLITGEIVDVRDCLVPFHLAED